jgi:prophage antirepressor-like protein
MIEEIKEDNNCIVKAFENNPISILKEQDGDKKVYYFKASDIGKALNLSNVRVSIQNFDEDEQVVRKAYTLGGQQDTLFLSSQGVYRLLYNSKKEIAKKFRKWAGAILDDIIFNESKELQRQLQEKESILINLETEHEETKRKLEKEKREKHLMQNRRWAHVLPKDTIYVYHDNAKDPESLIKVGKTKDLAQREREYSSFSKCGAIIYYRNVLDCSLAERVCHHLLDSYRVNRKQEWFKVSESVAKEIVDKVALFLDNDLVDKISKETIDSIDEIHETQKKEITFNTDFNKFIDEMCEVNNTHFCFKEDLRMAFRIWSKNTDKKLINDFLEYIKNNFKSGVEHTESLMRRNVWRGLSLKPLEYTIDNENEIKDYEQFILDECEVGYHHRISYHDFFHHYTKWAGIDKLHITKRREIQEYIENKFAGGRVHLSNNTKTTHLHGVWGLSIRGENGMKQKKLTRKSVSQICKETGKILNQWDSLSIAAEHLSMPRSTMSNLARFNRPSGNVYYTYS